MKSKNNVIALDIGGVCLNLRPELCAERLRLDTGDIPVELLTAVDKLERGMIDEKTCLDEFRRHVASTMSDEELIDAWNLILGEDMDGMPALAREIVALGYRFVFFSDISSIHLYQVYRQLSFANLVAAGVFSFEVGAKKPEIQMYEAFEKQHGRPVLYVDDKPENVEGGRLFGWTSHRFVGANELREAFFALDEVAP